VKSNKVSACCGIFTKQCDSNTKIDSPPSANGETPQKILALSLKEWERIFENDYHGFKRGD